MTKKVKRFLGTVLALFSPFEMLRFAKFGGFTVRQVFIHIL